MVRADVHRAPASHRALALPAVARRVAAAAVLLLYHAGRHRDVLHPRARRRVPAHGGASLLLKTASGFQLTAVNCTFAPSSTC